MIINKRIALRSVSIVASLALVAGATFAFFSDTETSVGNTFIAGAIDLEVDNTSYLNGVFNSGTSWLQPANLDDGQGPAVSPSPLGAYLFFDFRDLKPGDFGEDTISLHTDTNDSWACADVTLTSDDDNGLTEPEGDAGDVTPGAGEGELADAVDFIWWADDGDNVLEDGETPLPSGPLGTLAVGDTATVALADDDESIFSNLSVDPLSAGSLIGSQTYHVGKGWCFGDIALAPVTQDDQGQVGTPGQPGSNGPDIRGEGFTCSGVNENDTTQSDSLTADITFRAIQARNNTAFQCETPTPAPTPSPSVSPSPLPTP